MSVAVQEEIVFTREELYAQVWAEPMWTLAARFGLSDVGLAKTCRRYDIPVPPRGYWQQKQAGQPVRPTKLPKLPAATAARLGSITFRRRLVQPTTSVGEKHVVPTIVVPEVLSEPHPIVAHTIQALRRVKPAKDGMLARSPAADYLDVRVSLGTVDRAMRIMDAFAHACDERGYTISVVVKDKEAVTQVEVDGESIAFHVEESFESVPIPLEERRRPQYSWERPAERKDVPSGLLGFCIDATWMWFSGNARRSWRDGKKQRLDECLGQVVVGLQNAASAIKASNAAFEENQRRYKEEARQRKYAAWQADVDKKHREIIHEELSTMRTISELRAYIAFRRAHEENPSPVLEEWLTWVAGYAAKLEEHIHKHAGPKIEPFDENSYYY